jgi:hypothetical protein
MREAKYLLEVPIQSTGELTAAFLNFSSLEEGLIEESFFAEA